MVKRLLSTLIVAGACCMQAAGFNHGLIQQHQSHHVRLDLEVTTSANPASSFVIIPTARVLPSSSAVQEEDSTPTTTTTDLIRSDGNNNNNNNNLRDLPPVLQQITDERKNFQMNLGKAMDTLRKDMPYILKRTPDYCIYHDDITVVDPSGVQLTGIDSYKSSIKFMQNFIRFWFQDRSGLQYRMVYDFARSSIRVSWHVVLVPKVPIGKPLHLDGISMYKLDPDSGKIVEHKFEKLMINNTPVMPPYGVFSLLQQDWGMAQQPGVSIPAGI